MNFLRTHRLLILTAVLVALAALAAFYLLPIADRLFLLPTPTPDGLLITASLKTKNSS